MQKDDVVKGGFAVAAAGRLVDGFEEVDCLCAALLVEYEDSGADAVDKRSGVSLTIQIHA